LLGLLLRFSLVAGLVVYLPSLYAALSAPLPGMAVANTFAMAVLLALTLATSPSFQWRAGLYCLSFYVLAVALLIWVGPVGQFYLFGVTTLTTVLLGLRTGVLSSIICTLTLLGVGLGGWATAGMPMAGWTRDLTAWTVLTLNFALVNLLLTMAVGVLLATLDQALGREVAAAASFERERTVLRTLIDALPDIIFTKDTQGRYVLANTATLAQVGVEREADLIGKVDLEVFSAEKAREYADADRRVFAGEVLRNVEEPAVGPDGRTTWYLTTKVPFRDPSGALAGLIGICREITDLKRAAADRGQLLSRLQLQIERMPLGYLTTDAELRYTRWNPAAELMFGFREAEVLGRHPFDLIVADSSRAHVAQIFDRLVAGSMDAHGEAENLTRDGRSITCEWHNTPMFEEDGTFAGVLSLAQDITERRNLEQQLRQSQKLEAVGRLAGGVAHDFNNLLTLINGYSEVLLADRQLGAGAEAAAQAIRDAGERAAALTRQLLGFSRKSLLQPVVVDLHAVIADTSVMLRRIIGEDISLTIELAPLLHRIKIDPTQLNQVLMNLVVNARDAMPAGGTLTIETANVMRSAGDQHPAGERPTPHAMLALTDTGGGMTADVVARIFEPFYTTKPPGVGTGLGLAMVFGVVRQSGGTIDVESTPGQGSRFMLYFPAVPDPLPVRPVPALLTVMHGAETILVVEDEQSVRDLLLRSLARYGYTLLAARDGEDGLRVAQEYSGAIDLVLTDVVMPRMGGPELVAALRVRLPALRALFMSGYTDDAVVRHGLLEADVAFIQKPCTPQELARKIRSVLDEPTSAHGLS